ncbi:MAG: hypothetical protein RL325_921 [Planctomycetota bacterium]
MSPLSELLTRLDLVLPRDRRELRARIGGLEKRLRDGAKPDPRAIRLVEDAVARSIAERERRAALVPAFVPAVAYPPELPFTAALEPLREAIAAHQVVVVAGETGSGKSTQLPKLCLELGRGVAGRIAHTQPRRIAARSVARRIADELGVRLGGVVGVKVRFGDESGRDTLVKVLTDGMLLAETRGDTRLDEYDTVIVDEAHERSLNIDFLLGYLRRLVSRRPDLKVILTSATIDVERLSAHFGGAPIVEIPGRAHPIDIRYRPPEVGGLDEEDPRMLEAIGRAVDEIDEAFAARGGGRQGAPPDILVFLSGEREIREAEQFLAGRLKAREEGVGTEVLPLFARQGLDEQERIFAPGKPRRIVLATNVAETSLTVPRIHAVIDPGYARILRYSAKSRVQRLPVEAISQASARQRAGRAGRLGPGIAIRLYDEGDFTLRPPFTPPEIQRTNLASVILQMEALNLGKAEDFPFVDPPSARLVADGRATLVELGASTAEGRLTKTGRAMSLLPLDPRLSRMLLASIDERCTNDMLVVAAGLAVQDPRVRPQEKRDAADLAHARFRDPQSDFASFLRIWSAWRGENKDDAGRDLGSSARRRWCERHFLSYPRMREWADTVQQLKELFAEHFSLKVGEPSREVDQGAFHRAILAGFASHIGARTEKGEYRGPSGALFTVHPSSALARRTPNWIVAAEIVETTKRFARICARVQPDWIVRVAPHLCTRSQFEPHFVEETGQVAAWERTSFGELVVVPKKRVPFGPVDPAGARNVFIQEGLVAHRARTEGAFLAENRALREELEGEEERGRRRGMLLEEEAAFGFYDARVPAEVHSVPSFERWRREAEARDPALLRMRAEDLLRDDAERVDPHAFPRRIAVEALELPLAYAHDPEDAHDGVTARIPVEALAVLDPAPFEWLVPGLLAEKVEALVRSLPKHLRVRLFPIEEVVQGAVEALGLKDGFGKGSLKARLARHLAGIAQSPIAVDEFREDQLAPHLRMRAEDLLRDDAERVDPHAFPRRIAVEALELPLAYAHDPEDSHDGVTARIPVEALAVLDPAPFEWLVPGLLAEKVEALVRSLPKHLRVRLFPIEEVVQGSVEALGLKDGFGKGSLKARLARHLAGIAQSPIAVDDFREDQLAPHLRMRFSIVDADGRVLGEGRDVAELARRFAAVARDRLRASVDRATDPIAKIERDRVERLPDEPIPASISYTRAGIGLRGYPALAVEAPEGEPVVALRVFDGEAEAIRAHAVATARLLAAEIREAVEHHVAYDPGCEALLALLAHSGEEDGVGFIARLVAAGAIGEADQPPRSARDAIECERLAADRLHDRVAFVMRAVARILETAGEVESRLRGVVASPSGDAKARIAHRLAEILGSHGLAALEGCDRDELSQRLRLAEMLLARLERLREIGSARDRAIDDELAPLAERVALALRDRSRTPAERRNIRRMWEEIEISRYAPKLPRAFPASERRLEELLGE